ncbi:hypothetical protein JTB14_012718 [Gonioctena quinquepunctata]|nr:hypothetical protein JTB14_012718 [Gonioctena quinquepunctata]
MDFKKTSFIPHVAIVVDENNIEKGALEIVRFIKPEWKEDSIKFKLLTDGLTNNLVGCKPEGVDEAETVLVRVYGHKTDLLIDRTAETRYVLVESILTRRKQKHV